MSQRRLAPFAVLAACLGFFSLVRCSAGDDPALAKEIEVRLDELHAAGHLHGAAIVARGPERLCSKGLGLEHSGQPRPVTVTTMFHLASVSKLMTQIAALRLVDEGALDLDAPIAAYRPTLPDALGRRLTMRHLLTFSSGLPREIARSGSSLAGVAFDADGRAGPFLDDLDPALEFEPGSRRQYSNLGYWYAGAVLEAITGETFADAIDALVFAPAGMEQSGFALALRDAPGIAWPHEAFEGVLRPLDAFDAAPRYASGGLFSTARDLHRLGVALTSGDLLTESSRRELWTQFGTNERRRGEPRFFTGGLPGFANVFAIDPERGIMVILLNNTMHASPDLLVDVAREMHGLAAGDTPERARPRPTFDYSVFTPGMPDPTAPLATSVIDLADAIETNDVRVVAAAIERTHPFSSPPTDAKLRELARHALDLRARVGGWRCFGHRWNGDDHRSLTVIVRGDGTTAEARLTYRSTEDAPGRLASIDIRLTNIGSP